MCCHASQTFSELWPLHSIPPHPFLCPGENNVRSSFLISSQKLFPALLPVIWYSARSSSCPGNMAGCFSIFLSSQIVGCNIFSLRQPLIPTDYYCRAYVSVYHIPFVLKWAFHRNHCPSNLCKPFLVGYQSWFLHILTALLWGLLRHRQMVQMTLIRMRTLEGINVRQHSFTFIYSSA